MGLLAFPGRRFRAVKPWLTVELNGLKVCGGLLVICSDQKAVS
jgi:hypothetical protein